jgi:hypothetical protein
VSRDAIPPHGCRWGGWQLNAKALTLEIHGKHGGEDYEYEIDLECINNSAQMLDWIFQVRQKTWASNEVTGELLNALEDIFAPQITLCSWCREGGENDGQELDATEFLKERLQKGICHWRDPRRSAAPTSPPSNASDPQQKPNDRESLIQQVSTFGPHNACEECWYRTQTTEPVRVRDCAPTGPNEVIWLTITERCCICGKRNSDGIYFRHDGRELPCRGRCVV